MTFELTFESELTAPASEVWAAVSTLAGVNRELAPWLRMTSPREAERRPLTDAPLGRVLFTSTLVALGCLPFDRHQLCLVEAREGHFLERSGSLLQKSWEHERWVEAIPGGTRVRDRLRVVPRGAPDRLVSAVVRALFEWRHRRLRQRFGCLGDSGGVGSAGAASRRDTRSLAG